MFRCPLWRINYVPTNLLSPIFVCLQGFLLDDLRARCGPSAQRLYPCWNQPVPPASGGWFPTLIIAFLPVNIVGIKGPQNREHRLDIRPSSLKLLFEYFSEKMHFICPEGKHPTTRVASQNSFFEAYVTRRASPCELRMRRCDGSACNPASSSMHPAPCPL